MPFTKLCLMDKNATMTDEMSVVKIKPNLLSIQNAGNPAHQLLHVSKFIKLEF